MTAAQNSIALKGSRSYGNMLAVVVIGLIVAIVVVAINARSLAPATSAGNTSPLTLGHDEARFTVPTLTTGHDEARPSSVEAQPGWYIPGQSQILLQGQPAPRVGGPYMHSQSQLPVRVGGPYMHSQSQFPAPTVPLTPRGGGGDRAQ